MNYLLSKHTMKQSELLEIFNLTLEQSLRPQILYINRQINHLTEHLDLMVSTQLQTTKQRDRDLIRELNKDTSKEIDKLIKKKHYLNQQIKRAKNPNLPPPAFTQQDIDYIKENTPIELVMGTPPVKRTINRSWYRCPFHDEDTPSFVWNEDKHYFKCFGCGQGGDIITLHQHLNGTTFKETVDNLI